jgi:hypothetical protein
VSNRPEPRTPRSDPEADPRGRLAARTSDPMVGNADRALIRSRPRSQIMYRQSGPPRRHEKLQIADVKVAGVTVSSRLVGGCAGTQPGSLLEEFAAFCVRGGGVLLSAGGTICLHLRFVLLAIG